MVAQQEVDFAHRCVTPRRKVNCQSRFFQRGRGDGLRAEQFIKEGNEAREEALVGTLRVHRAVVAIARKLLITVWHVLRREVVDKHHDPRDVACSLFRLAYAVKVRKLPGKQSALQFTRNHIDRLGIGADLQKLPWGTRNFTRPPSRLKPK